jgi:hypothetical protein
MLHFTSVNLHSFISRPVLTSSWFYDFSWDIFSGSRFPSILDMYYFWNSETYTLTECEERTLNQLIYEGLPPRIPVDHVKREVRKRQLRFRVSYPPEFHHLFTESDSDWVSSFTLVIQYTFLLYDIMELKFSTNKHV